MIILDTNVVSAAMDVVPSPVVESWFSRQLPDELYVSVITITELQLGVETLPAGRRRDDLQARVEVALSSFGPVFVSLGVAAAHHCAELLARHPEADLFDIQIAAIALSRGAAVATRNTKHFKGFGVELIDPWAA